MGKFVLVLFLVAAVEVMAVEAMVEAEVSPSPPPLRRTLLLAGEAMVEAEVSPSPLRRTLLLAVEAMVEAEVPPSPSLRRTLLPRPLPK